MAIREAIRNKKSIGVGIAVAFLAIACIILIYSSLPAHRIKGDKAFYTVDDGKTWFLDDTYRVPPFDRDGQTAVRAMVYSYDNGHGTFCAYLTRFTPSAKKALDDAVADAARQGKPPSSVGLFNDRQLNSTGVEVKIPGPGHSWVLRSSTEGADAMNTGMAAHADSTSDLVIPE